MGWLTSPLGPEAVPEYLRGSALEVGEAAPGDGLVGPVGLALLRGVRSSTVVTRARKSSAWNGRVMNSSTPESKASTRLAVVVATMITAGLSSSGRRRMASSTEKLVAVPAVKSRITASIEAWWVVSSSRAPSLLWARKATR